MVAAGTLGGYIASFSKELTRGCVQRLLPPLYRIVGAFFLCVASLRKSWRSCLLSGHSGSPLLLLAVLILLPVASAVAEDTQLPVAEPRRQLQGGSYGGSCPAAGIPGIPEGTWENDGTCDVPVRDAFSFLRQFVFQY